MKTLIFQHTEEENPGSLTTWLSSVNFPFQVHHIYRGEAMPAPENFDWLVVLGGPMNVEEVEKHPWLLAEKAFIKNWLLSKKPLLGICLGGQLLAEALGGKVSKNSQREIGFHPVHRTGQSHPAFSDWPESLSVFQWHEDRFSLPPGCRSILTSTVCEHQAFALNDHTVGFQFHPESSESWILGNFVGFSPEAGEKYVQSKEECAALIPSKLAPMTNQFFFFLENYCEFAKRGQN